MTIYFGDGSSQAAAGVVHGGKILQVVSSYKSDSWSASTNNNFHYVTGLNPSLTPLNSSSKILVVISLGCLGMNNHTAGVRIERIVSGNGTWIANGAGSQNRPQFAFGTNSRDSYHQGGVSYSYLDSPGTTSAVSYKIYAGGHSNGTVCVNRTNGDQNDANLESGRRSSSIHLLEVGG